MERPHFRRGARTRTGRYRGLLIVGALALLFGWVVASSPAIVTAHLRVQQVPHSAGLILQSWSDTFLVPWFWGFVVFIVALERLLPASESGGMFSVGAAQDFVWFVFFAGFQLTVVHLYYVLLGGADQQLRHGVALHLSSLLGGPGAVAFAFVAVDLLNWFTHYVRHRVPAFWHFHEIHHSQRSMNMFTDARVHFVEPMVASTLVFVPSTLLGLSVHEAAVIVTTSLFYQRFFHANIRTDLGPLRYVLVTPQSHRIHHSNLAEHYDTNFAVIFSIWDRLFGTQYHSHDEYPPTGLANPALPVETSARPVALLTTYARQLAYPFRAARERSLAGPTSRMSTSADHGLAASTTRVA